MTTARPSAFEPDDQSRPRERDDHQAQLQKKENPDQPAGPRSWGRTPHPQLAAPVCDRVASVSPVAAQHVAATVADMALVHLESGASKHNGDRTIAVLVDNQDQSVFRDRLHSLFEKGGTVYLVNKSGQREAQALNMAKLDHEDRSRLVNQIVDEGRTFDLVTRGSRVGALRDAIAVAGNGRVSMGDKSYDLGRIQPLLTDAQQLLHAQVGDADVDEGTLRVAVGQLAQQLAPHARSLQQALDRDPSLVTATSSSLHGFLAAAAAGFGVHAFEEKEKGATTKYLLELERRWEDEPSVTKRLSAEQQRDPSVRTWMRGGLDLTLQVSLPPPSDQATTMRITPGGTAAKEDDGDLGGVLLPV